MADFDDVTLRRSSADPAPPPRTPRPLLPILIVIALVAIAGGGWYWWRSNRAAGQPAASAANANANAPAPSATAERTPLPPLDAMDPLVRQLVSALSSHPKIAAWLTTDDLVRNVVVSVQNVAEGPSPKRHLKVIAPEGAFVVVNRGGRLVIDPRSYQRYDGHADAVGALDAAGTARLYETLKPRLDEAHKELDPGGTFDATLQRAIVALLSTPVVDGPLRLEPGGGTYRFADPTLESLTPAQRQLLRMGPRNQRIVQQKLREIARQLQIPEGRLPAERIHPQ
jgi:hypothetical protein